jgi:hypothetical protein
MKRILAAIEAEGPELTDDQRQCLADGVLSEIDPELNDLRTKLRAANKERGRISTRLYLARLQLREAQQRMQRMQRNREGGVVHQDRLLRLLRDLMHAIDPSRPDGPLIEDLEHCLGLAQRHRHELARRAQADQRDT